MAILIFGKMNFKTKTCTKDIEEYFIMIIGSIHKEAITVISIYVSNNKTPKYMKEKQTKLKRKQVTKNNRNIERPLALIEQLG